MIKISIKTHSRTHFINVTGRIQEAINALPAWDGLLHVFIPHTTAGVTINENADPDVAADMTTYFDKLVPWNNHYAHGEGNSAAHIKTTMAGPMTLVPVRAGRISMGTWQGIFLCEWDGPRTREIWLTPVAGGEK